MEAREQDRILYRFGTFTADPRSGDLLRANHKQKIQAQPFKILIALLERNGDVITRSELRQRLWSDGTTVEFDARLGTAVNKLREALGDSAENPRFIETLAGIGYRFIAPVQRELQAPDLELPAESQPAGIALPPAIPHSPEVAKATSDPQPTPTPKPRRYLVAFAGTLLLLFLATLGIFHFRRPATPANLRIEQITRSGRVSPGDMFLEDLPSLASDGVRLYFPQVEEGQNRFAEALISNGESSLLSLPSEIVAPLLGSLAPDGSRLILCDRVAGESEHSLWIVPTTGGTARQLHGILAHDATWMPDGQHLLIARQDQLLISDDQGNDLHLFAQLPGRGFWLRWSPNHDRLALTILNPATHATTLWQIHQDGSHLAPLLDHWSQPAHECCSTWSADGHSLYFQSEHDGSSNLWQLAISPITGNPDSHPTQLTSGPLSYQAPTLSPDGHSLFFIGSDSRSDLLAYSPESHQFSSYAPGLTAPFHLSYSADHKWMAWIGQDATLWRGRADGSEKLQITMSPMQVYMARWAPDGRHLLLMARSSDQLWQLYLVDPDGANLHPIFHESRNQSDPDWSPDGSQIVFGRIPALMGESGQPKAIHILHPDTGKLDTIPGSEGLFSPRWSPDGRYIVAISLGMDRLMLFDTTTKRWTRLADHSCADPVWASTRNLLYFTDYVQKNRQIYRIRIPDGKPERIVSLSDVHAAVDDSFAGLTPDDRPLVHASILTSNIYRIELKP